ncbi:MAG: Ig-like domain-containing protein [Verrucomicrobia bacterium]|nr:Ig-like domain-containing protein [Verrucomicrobiota bacterium]
MDTGADGVLKVTTLTVNGVSQSKGAYTASSGFVLGSGYIDVDNFGPPVFLNPPGVPASPTPADAANAIHPASLAKLTWAAATEAASYDVYLWLASATKPVTPTANVSLTEYALPAQVLPLETYQWQVVAKNILGSTAGPEWTFSTMDRRDISGTLTQSLDAIIGTGPARLIADVTTHWASETSVSNVNLNSFQLTVETGGGNGHTYHGAITGPGTLRIQGRGDASWDPEIVLGGTLANRPDGVILTSGHVALSKTAGVDALAGPITVNTDGTVRIHLSKNDQINDASTITSTASSGFFHLEMNGFRETISGLTIKPGHTVATGTGGVLTVTDLTVNDVPMSPGTYTSSSGFVTGTGSVIVPGATTPAAAGTSTVAASPTSQRADGVSTATITVTLLNATSNPVAGKNVTLASSRAAGTDTISAASGSSNAYGVVIFTVKSSTPGTPVFTATDVTDSNLAITQTATVTFTAATNVMDISNTLNPWEPANPAAGIKIDVVVVPGKTARLVGLTQTHWTSGGFSRAVDLNDNTLIIDSGGGNACTASGAISGNGLVRVNAGGIGILHLNGSVGNTYTGTTEINNGPVKLGKTTGNALNGTITVNGVMSNNFPGTGTLWWGANNQINDASNLTLSAGASLNFAGYSDTLGTCALTGDANLYLTGSTSIAHFADSSATTWTAAKQLVIPRLKVVNTP